MPPLSRAISQPIPILTAKAATGVGSAHDVSNYEFLQIHLSTASSATLTVKIQVSQSTTEPDWTSDSDANWTYCGFYDLDSGSFVAGSTGISAAGTDIKQIVKVNIDYAKWVNIRVTSRSAGNVSAQIVGAGI